MKYYLIAGEASGDLHGSNLMLELKAQDKEAVFRCIGGEKMQAAGATLLKHYKEMAYMGFIPVLLHLPTILKNMDLCKNDIKEWQPDVVILIDYPGFNLKIAEYVQQEWKKNLGIDVELSNTKGCGRAVLYPAIRSGMVCSAQLPNTLCG